MKRNLIIYNIFIVLIILCTSVYAATTAKLNLTMTPDNTKLKSGEKLSVKLSLKDFDNDVSVDTISGYIDINENIIEDLTISNIVRTNATNGTVKIGNEELEVYDVSKIGEGLPEKGIFLMKDPADAEHDYKITIELSSNNKIKTEDIIGIEFKTKDNLSEKTYEDVIKFVGFEATSGWTETVTIENKSTSIEIVAEKNTNTNTSNTTNTNTTNTNTNNTNKANTNNNINTNKNTNKNTNSNKATNTNTKNTSTVNKIGTNTKDNTTSNKILPATGTTSIIVKIIAVGLLLGFIVYAKYKKYKNI